MNESQISEYIIQQQLEMINRTSAPSKRLYSEKTAIGMHLAALDFYEALDSLSDGRVTTDPILAYMRSRWPLVTRHKREQMIESLGRMPEVPLEMRVSTEWIEPDDTGINKDNDDNEVETTDSDRKLLELIIEVLSDNVPKTSRDIRQAKRALRTDYNNEYVKFFLEQMVTDGALDTVQNGDVRKYYLTRD